ncbi:NTPase [Photobacterium angustum]|uniref:KAP family P-loop NTPase fold protein n=2 Tax=Photobacterium angustum TaxID=661 RepID=UPI000D160EFD|nr:KAP family NTPase [Photobacterium angustum]PSW91432.1 NTPase [Photobacterium angustum]
MAKGDIDFDWNETRTLDNGLVLPSDALNRSRYAKFLYNYLVDNSSQNGYVLNLNAQWGAGKTYFINRWMDSIKDTHPVVYIDAWKQDYSNDPMLTVVSSITDSLEKLLPDGNHEAIDLKNKATRFFKAAAPFLIKGLIKKATGMNIDEVDDEISSDSDISGEIGAALSKCLIDDHNEKLKTVEYLRDDIKSLITAIDPKKELELPAFIFIDELDRCRPTYAVEMLEVIKHFFEIENIVFVVATDTEQLQHAVKAIYGEGFDAQTYLGRFFRRRYSLTETSRYEFVKQMVGESYEIKKEWELYVPTIECPNDIWEQVSIISNIFNLSLRETEQLTDKYLAILSSNSKNMSPYLLLILFVLRDKFYSIYASWINYDNNSSFKIENQNFNTIKLSFLRNNNGGFNASTNLGCFGFDLSDFLITMNKYCYNSSPMDKQNISNDLQRTMNYNNGNDGHKDYLKMQLLYLSALKKDYIEWVEYATSFDE